jgi:predicted porin
MKLSRIAAAAVVAAAAMSASAQSNVTLYGIIDIGYLYTNPANGPNTS